MNKLYNLDLSIVIINYNLENEIENCLNSILLDADIDKLLNFEIIIVDNASPNKKLTEVEKKFQSEKIHFYYLSENIGFGKGCNYAFEKVLGRYVCFLNPDTILSQDIFSPIIELFQQDPSIGIIGPRQQIRGPFFDFSAGFSPNIFFEFVNILGIGVFLESFILRMYVAIIPKEIYIVNWVLGACLCISSDLFGEVGGFDKDYFMFFEEVDLCLRTHKKGYKTVYKPDLKIHHIGSVSGKKDYNLYTIRTYSSKFLYLSKNYKSTKRTLLLTLLRIQLFSQIIIWTLLFPLKRDKSKQKIFAFVELLKTGNKYEHRN